MTPITYTTEPPEEQENSIPVPVGDQMIAVVCRLIDGRELVSIHYHILDPDSGGQLPPFPEGWNLLTGEQDA